MIDFFAPRWYYRGTVSKEGQLAIRSSLGSFIKDDNNFRYPEGWNCDVKTSYGLECNNNAPFEKFMENTSDNITEFLGHFNPKVAIDLLPQEFWVNRYSKGQFQEYHDHAVPQVNLGVVYFYQLDDINKSDFTFYNKDHSDYKKCGLDDIFNLPASLEVNPTVSEGDLIIFPSFYPHLVKCNKSDSERITISANLFVAPKKC